MTENIAIYVSPNGKDENIGSIEYPFSTIERAMAEVRKINNSMNCDIIVYLRDGEYFPSYRSIEKELVNRIGEGRSTFPLRVSNLQFTPEDNGKNGFNVIFSAYENEKPVITGGKRILGWELYDKEKNLYRSYLGIETRHLYINGKRAVRAKKNIDYSFFSEFNKESNVNGKPEYITNDTSFLKLRNIDKVEFVYNSGFTFPRCCVEKVEQESHDKVNIYMKQPGFYYCTHKGGTSVDYPTWIENAFEFLERPNDFYYDYSDGYIYYIPDYGVDMNNVDAVVPVIDRLLSLSGINKYERVENIKFENIKFEYTEWLRPSYDNGHCDSQNNHIREFGLDNMYSIDGDTHAEAAIELEYAKNIVFENCTVSKTGITALKIIKASHNNMILGCEFYDTSGSAIVIGDQGWRESHNKINVNSDDKQDLLVNNCIKNCYIHDCASEYLSAAPISIAYTIGTEISNNDIFNCPYTAIHIGYGWAEVKNVCTRGLKICNNYIDTFMAKLFDGGGIYTLGATGGTNENPNVISGNFLRNQIEAKFGALYFDEASSNWKADNNVFENTPMWCHISVLSPDNHDICIKNSYITNGYLLYDKNLKQININIEERKIIKENRFDDEGEEIIKRAGLQGKYIALRKDYNILGSAVFGKSIVCLKTNGKIATDLIIRTVRGVIMNDVAVQYKSMDNDILEIDQQGHIFAKKSGKSTVVALVTDKEKTIEALLDVCVDDIINKVNIIPQKNSIRVGGCTTLKVIAETLFERQIEVEEYKLNSENGILKIDKNDNTVYALKAGKGYLSVEYEGIKSEATIEVVEKPTGDPISDFVFWDNNSCSKLIYDDKRLTLFCDEYRGYAYYTGMEYGDIILEFNFTLEANKKDWPCLVFRSKSKELRPIDKGNEAYMVVINHKYIEPQRFNNGERTLFYGTVAGCTSVTGEVIANTYIKQGETCKVKCGTINLKNGVRLFMEVNGEKVFDYIDDSESAITENGFFGMVVNNGKITIEKP